MADIKKMKKKYKLIIGQLENKIIQLEAAIEAANAPKKEVAQVADNATKAVKGTKKTIGALKGAVKKVGARRTVRTTKKGA